MTINEFSDRIIQRFGFTPTNDQLNAINTFGRFLASRQEMPMMIMRGSAGTGKTSLVAAMVQTLASLKQKVILMAPTGRAAKVLSLNAGMPAFTIHRKIYRQKALMGDFNLNDNLYSNALFVVDEASMISSLPSIEGGFGSGCLLDDLVKYVYSGNNCRLMLIGDTAQLPPVGEDEAPALMAEVMMGYGASIFECDLREVLRQSKESGILHNATFIRQLIQHEDATELPKLTFKGFKDIQVLPGNEIIDSLNNSYRYAGMDDTIVITRSNKNATIYNNGIRNTVLDRDEILCSGDQLMIVKNNYYWTEEINRKHKGEETEKAPAFLANGDRAKVLRVRNIRELYGFTFADLTISLPDYDDYEMDIIAIIDALQSDFPALSQEQNEALFKAIEEDYADIPRKADRIKAIRDDKYFNAVQIKYAYAITCHKAQGGQWSHVYVDQGYMTDDMLTPDYIHWLYTALTRATEKLYLVNWPKNQQG